MLEKAHFRRAPVSEERFAVNILFGNQAPVPRIGRVIPVVAHDEVVVLVDLLRSRALQCLIVLEVEIIFPQLLSIDKDATVSHLDGFIGQPYDALHIALIRIVGKPEHDNIAAFEMSPADTLDLVINELVDQQSLAVVQLRKHRRAFDHNGLHSKHTEQDKNNDDQKDVSDQPQAFCPDTLARFASKMDDLYITIVARRHRSELVLVFPAEIEHNRLFDESAKRGGWLPLATLEISREPGACQRLFPMNEHIRSLFPALKNYTYLNSAAVSPLPATAIEAVHSQLVDVATNGTLNYLDWVATKNRARELVASMLGVRPEQVAFMRNTSDGFASVASGMDWDREDNIVSFAGEFPANFYPWRRVRDRYGVELRLVPERNGRIDLDEFVELIDAKTRLVAISAVQFASGFTADLGRIAEAARAADALFAVDIIQALGARGFDLPSLGVDIASGASHKWMCAPEGCGMLYVSDRARDRVDPSFVGWISVETPWDFEDREQPFKPNALAWESGTGCSSLFYGLEQSAKLLVETGLARIHSYLEELTDFLCELVAGKDYEIVSSRTPGEKSSIVCIRHRNGLPSTEIAKRLEEQKIIVSPRGDRVRIAPHFYNDREDIERLASALP